MSGVQDPGLAPGSDSWLEQVSETVLDPGRPVIDPHHHLWKKRFGRDYLLEDLWADTSTGHNIVKTVFVECRAFYHRQGPEHMRPAGETAFIAEQARKSRAQHSPGRPVVAGIVAHADLMLGREPGKLRELLSAHQENCEGLLRGIRHPVAWDEHGADLVINLQCRPGLYREKAFRQGLRVLASQDLVFDAWHYHHQNREFLDLVRALPEVTFVLDHFGTPLGTRPYRGQRAEIHRQWRKDIAELGRCPNVYAKLGGLSMPDNGFGWDFRALPASSDELLAAQQDYYHHTIDCFGPERCMFESNFPVDRLSVSYPVLWNAFKKLSAGFSESEKNALFHDSAAAVYRL